MSRNQYLIITMNINLLKKLKSVPILLFLLPMILYFLGLFILFFACDVDFLSFFKKQLIYLVVFLTIIFLLIVIDIRIIYRLSYFFFFTCILLLIYAFFLGDSVMGARRWIDLLGVTFQPAELMKVAVILSFSKFLNDNNIFLNKSSVICFINDKKSELMSKVNFLLYLLTNIFIIFLIFIQPDLGTSVIVLLLILMLFFVVACPIKYFVFLGLLFLCMIPVLWPYLKDYQKNRILVFFNPSIDPKGSGYNILQSKIAIGSGGFIGKGINNGTQSNLKFLPEYKTDFIFSHFAEETGFIGVFCLILLYVLLVMYLFFLADNVNNKFQKLVILSFAILIFIHCFINISMTIGILPVVGIPLPFISYGGSVTFCLVSCLGLSMNAYINKNVKL